MAAPTSLERHSSVRATIPGTGDQAELLLVGFELLATRPQSMDGYLDAVGGFIAHSGPMLAVDIEAGTGTGTEFWAFRPRDFAQISGTTTVTATLLDLGDGLMVFVGLGVTGAPETVDLDACAEFAASALASAAPGSRKPDWSAAPHPIPTPGGEALTVARPAGWAAFTNIMYDHSVTYFMELLPLWADPPANVTIYVGHHANPRPPEGSEARARTLAGREIDWHEARDGELTIGMGMLDSLLGHDHVVVHTLATNPTNAAAIDGLVDSLRVGE